MHPSFKLTWSILVLCLLVGRPARARDQSDYYDGACRLEFLDAKDEPRRIGSAFIVDERTLLSVRHVFDRERSAGIKWLKIKCGSFSVKVALKDDHFSDFPHEAVRIEAGQGLNEGYDYLLRLEFDSSVFGGIPRPRSIATQRDLDELSERLHTVFAIGSGIDPGQQFIYLSQPDWDSPWTGYVPEYVHQIAAEGFSGGPVIGIDDRGEAHLIGLVSSAVSLELSYPRRGRLILHPRDTFSRHRNPAIDFARRLQLPWLRKTIAVPMIRVTPVFDRAPKATIKFTDCTAAFSSV